MRRSAITLVFLSVLTLLAEAQTNLSSVTVKWKKNGVWNTNTYNPNATSTITPDLGSAVNVTITRTANAPVPSEFTVSDWNNGATHTQTSTSTSVTFIDCAGSLNTQLWAMVNTVEGNVRINVEWSQAAKPDLSISQLTVNASANPSGKVFQVGESVTVRSIVWNVGGLQAGGSQLAYFIKTTADNTSGSPFITSQVPTIPSGKGSTQQSYYTFTSNDLGTRYFVLEADHSAQVNEASESNNVRSFGPFQVVSPPSMNISPSSADYGNVLIRECSQENTFVLINDGGTALNGQVTLETGEHFSITTGGGNFSLNPGQSRTIKAKFCPKTAGQKTDKIRVFADNYGSHPLQANLTGNASNPPEIIVGISDEFLFDTRNPIRNSGGIFLKIIETAGTKKVKSAGYEYNYYGFWQLSPKCQRDTNKFEIDSHGNVFLTPPDFPLLSYSRDDFLNEILLFDEKDQQIGHISFSYSFEWEGMNTRHAILFLHNDGDIFGGNTTDNTRYFPYHANSPNNPVIRGEKFMYNYYKQGEYPVSMLIPPHFIKDEGNDRPGYRFPNENEKTNVKPVLFVHGLTGTFSYQKKAKPELTAYEGDQVSYWFDTERKLNSKEDAGVRKYHAWQYYYPNEDDLTHCGLMLKKAVDHLYNMYEKQIHFISHSMGGVVTMEFMTRENNYNQQKIGRVLLSMPPVHGSLAANKNYNTALGRSMGSLSTIGEYIPFIGDEIANLEQDGKAPAYRDLSIGSDFMINLHSRAWDQKLIKNTFCLIGLTNKNYKLRNFAFNEIHNEAQNHNDGVVSFSSASLIEKGIGFLGYYGNHDDGKYSRSLADTNFVPNIIDSYLSDPDPELSSFKSFCKEDETVDVIIDKAGMVVKPESNNLNNLNISKPRVDFQKGVISFYSNTINYETLEIWYRSSNNQYILQAPSPAIATNNQITTGGLSDLVVPYGAIRLGNIYKNKFKSLNSDIPLYSYYFQEGVLNNTAFSFPVGNSDPCPDILLYKHNNWPQSLEGNICTKYMEYQFIPINIRSTVKKSTTLLTNQETPTKSLVKEIISNTEQSSLFIDDQTSFSEFYLYSLDAHFSGTTYSLELVNPEGTSVDSASQGISYYNDPATSVKKISIEDPLPGEWKVILLMDSDENENFHFITKAELVSEIKAESNIKREHYDIFKPIILSSLIKVPDKALLNTGSLNAFAIINRAFAPSDTIYLTNIVTSDTATLLYNEYLPDSAGLLNYVIIIEGIYNGYKFERAVYGESVIYDMTPYLSIPDQDLSITNISFDLNLMNYLHCPGCIQDSIRFEVSQVSSAFPEEDLFYSFESENNRFSLMVSQSAASSEAMFAVECFASDSLIVSRTFKVRYTAPGIPRGLSTYLLTRESAGLSWIATGTETQWEVMYGPEGFNPETEGTLIEGVPEEKFSLTGLPGSTAYDFYVRAVYDEGAVKGPWSWPGTFTTAHLITSSAGLYGTIEPSGETEVLDNSIQTYRILPDEHYHVSELIIDGEPADILSDYTFRQVSQNHTIYAGFSVNFYTLEYRSGKNGTLSGELSQTVEYNNHGAPVEAIPDNGYYFSGWSDGVMENPRTDLNVSGNKKITALFNVLTSSRDELSKSVHIYPNPATHEFIVNSAIKVTRIEMADITGKMVYHQKVNSNLWRISCNSLDDGIYIIFIHMNEEVITRKIIIKK